MVHAMVCLYNIVLILVIGFLCYHFGNFWALFLLTGLASLEYKETESNKSKQEKGG